MMRPINPTENKRQSSVEQESIDKEVEKIITEIQILCSEKNKDFSEDNLFTSIIYKINNLLNEDVVTLFNITKDFKDGVEYELAKERKKDKIISKLIYILTKTSSDLEEKHFDILLKATCELQKTTSENICKLQAAIKEKGTPKHKFEPVVESSGKEILRDLEEKIQQYFLSDSYDDTYTILGNHIVDILDESLKNKNSDERQDILLWLGVAFQKKLEQKNGNDDINANQDVYKIVLKIIQEKLLDIKPKYL